MLSFKPNGEREHRKIPLKKWVKRQQELLAETLIKIFNHIENKELEHKKNHGRKKLGKIFHPSLPWLCGHILAVSAMSRSEELIKARVALETIGQMVDEFALAVEERGENAASFIAPIKRAITRVAGHFDNYPWDADQQFDFDIVAFFLEKHLVELRQIALEIDIEYSQFP